MPIRSVAPSIDLTPPALSPAAERRIGVVAIGRNEGARIGACLRSVAGTGPVVYVDSASTDDSVAVARANGAAIVALSDEVPLTTARGRNAGFRALSEIEPGLDYVQFVDGDCEVLPGWIEAAATLLDRNPKVAAVCGRRMERDPDASIYNAMCDREWNTPVGFAQACGGDSLVRAAAFAQAGGFLEDQIAHEEPELCGRLRALGWTIYRHDAPMTIHDARMTRFGQFFRRNRRAGLGLSQYLRRVRPAGSDEGRRIVRRALIWAIALPLLIVALLLIDWRASALLLALYPAQLLRNAWRARRSGWNARQSLQVAALSLLGKFAEASGVIEYWWKTLLGRRARNVFYR